MMNVKVKNLTVGYDLKQLITDLSFSLGKGDRLALIGEEGNGKSTLLNLIYNYANNIPVVCDYDGDIFIEGSISRVTQTINDWFEYTVLDYIFNEDKENLSYEHTEHIDYFYRHLTEFNLNKKMFDDNVQLKYLSGGELMKLKLLKLFSKGSEIIILDEPTNDLDTATIELLEKLIINYDGIVIFATHDISLIKNCSNKILHIEIVNRKNKPKATLYSGSYDEYIGKIKDEFEKKTHQQRNERKEYLKNKDRLNDIYNKSVSALKSVSRSDPHKARVLKKTVKRTKKMIEQNEDVVKTKVDTPENAINIIFKDSSKSANIVYHLDGYNLYINDRLLIKDIKMNLMAGEKYVIMGNNGCGKTTLVKKVIDDLNQSGANYFYLPQKYNEVLKGSHSAFDFVKNNTEIDITNDEINNVLTSMGLNFDEINNSILNLSEGQKVKLILTLIMIKDYDILILDELTRNVSPLNLEVIIEALTNYKGCILAVSHDRYYISKVFDKKIIVEDLELKLEDN